jgi:hypothetical protein
MSRGFGALTFKVVWLHYLLSEWGCHFTICEEALTGSATCHDEIIEFSIAGNKVVGYRNMMEEMHLAQDKPTVIYQDNEAAIMIEKNRGSLSGQSRHIERKVLTCRNKVEDGQIVPVYLETSRMAADIGTKALGLGRNHSVSIKCRLGHL